jgi:hypothetical protein
MKFLCDVHISFKIVNHSQKEKNTELSGIPGTNKTNAIFNIPITPHSYSSLASLARVLYICHLK